MQTSAAARLSSLHRSVPLHRGWLPAVAVLSMGLLHAGPAAASIPDASGLFHGCYKKSDSNLRIIDDAVTSCSANEIEVTWSQQGPPGQTGATGPRGPSDAYLKDQRSSFSAVTISTSRLTTILTLPQLPAGSYVVNASVAIVSTATTTGVTTQCELRAAGGPILSEGFQATSGLGSNAFLVLPITTAFTVSDATDVNVCRTTAAGTQSQPSAITAIRVGDLH